MKRYEQVCHIWSEQVPSSKPGGDDPHHMLNPTLPVSGGGIRSTLLLPKKEIKKEKWWGAVLIDKLFLVGFPRPRQGFVFAYKSKGLVYCT